MSKINVPLVEVMVRRDANTITPVTVPPYELTMLRQMFGKENVNGDKTVATLEVDAAGEFERLSAKYGAQKVIKVYGDDGGERLTELVEKSAVKAGKPKAEKADKTEEAAQ
jgi:hypothetical protein